MSPSLATPDPAAWNRAVTRLLSPLDYPSERAWVEQTIDALAELFGGFAGFAALGRPGSINAYHRGLPENAFEAVKTPLLGVGTERIRYSDPVLDRGLTTLVQRGVEVWDVPLAERLTQLDFEKNSWFYSDILVSHRLENFVIMATALPEGQALCGVSFEDRCYGRFGEQARTLMSMLLPAFRSGVQTLETLQQRRTHLAAAFDALDQPAALYDADGRERHRNPAFDAAVRLLGDGPRVAAAVDAVVGDLKLVLRGNGSAPGRTVSERMVTTRTGVRSVRATMLARATVERGPSILVTVAGQVPAIPEPGPLRKRYHLTMREAEVARILALGRSNKEIAALLGISEHTARHHAQAVLEKVGVHSRKALGIRLLEDAAAAGERRRPG